MYAQDVSDPQQHADAGVDVAGLDVLERFAADVRGEVDAFLGAVLAEPFDADAVADGAPAFEEPGVIVRKVGHLLTLDAR